MKRRLATLGLVAFLLLDIVLVYFALRPSPASEAQPSVPPTVPTSTAGSTSTSKSTPATGTSTKPTATPREAVPPSVLIAAFDADVAWRATVGSCDKGGSTFATTKDGGRTWQQADAAAEATARIQPLGAGRGFSIGAAEDCVLAQFSTSDDGAKWEGPAAIDGGWSRRLDEPSMVTTPQQVNARPCGDGVVLDLSRTSAQQAEALCSDGGVKVTHDGGRAWADSGEAPGAVALSNRLEGGVLSTYVARLDGSCAGVQIVKVIKGKAASPIACVDAPVPDEGGQIAISVVADSGWLLVGDRVWTAGTALTEWAKA